MKRFIANYLFVAGRGVLHNQVLTLDDSGRILNLAAVDDELAYTIYVSNPVVVLATCDKDIFNEVFHRCGSLNELATELSAQSLRHIKQGDKPLVLECCICDDYINVLS